jgi:hypothetical protein
MARYRATVTTERQTEPLRSWVTPAQGQQLETAAKEAGVGLSEYVRRLCLRRPSGAPVVAGTTRNPTAKLLADELRAIGINLNQLARVANQTGEIRREEDLDRTLHELKATMARVISL